MPYPMYVRESEDLICLKPKCNPYDQPQEWLSKPCPSSLRYARVAWSVYS